VSLCRGIRTPPGTGYFYGASHGCFRGCPDPLVQPTIQAITSGASWAEFATGSGGWSGVKGPTCAPGWTVHPGQLS
jgi:hypothetical protein